MNSNLYTLTLKDVAKNNCKEYIEEICNQEHVKIKTVYEDSYSFLNGRPDWVTDRLKSGDDLLLESVSYDKLQFIQYLYDNRVKNIKLLNDIHKIGEENNRWDALDSLTYYTPFVANDGVYRTSSPAQLGNTDFASPALEHNWVHINIPKYYHSIGVDIPNVSFNFDGEKELYRGPNGKVFELTDANSDYWKNHVRETYEKVPVSKPIQYKPKKNDSKIKSWINKFKDNWNS